MSQKLRNDIHAVAPMVPPIVGILTTILLYNHTADAWYALAAIHIPGALYVVIKTKELQVVKEMKSIYKQVDASWLYARFVLKLGWRAYIVFASLAIAAVWFFVLSYRQRQNGHTVIEPVPA